MLRDEAGEVLGAHRADPAGQALDLGVHLRVRGRPLEGLREKLEKGGLLDGVATGRTLSQ